MFYYARSFGEIIPRDFTGTVVWPDGSKERYQCGNYQRSESVSRETHNDEKELRPGGRYYTESDC